MRPWSKVKFGLLGAACIFYVGAMVYFWILPGGTAVDTEGSLISGRGPAMGAVMGTLVIGLLLAVAAYLSFRPRRWLAYTIIVPLWLVTLFTFIPGGLIVWIPLLLTTVACTLPIGGGKKSIAEAQTG